MNDQTGPGLPSARILFQRTPQIGQMQDPLQAGWNRDLGDGQAHHALHKLIDFSQMNAVFQNFLAVVGLPVCIIDLDGRVLASSNWQRLCLSFHRAAPDTLNRCLESDRNLSRQMEDGKSYAIYRCLNGLTDCAAPIIIEGRHIANLFIGQFFVEPPDMDFFRQLQTREGFEPAAYFKALAEVPIVARDKIPDILNLFSGLAHQVAQQSLAENRALAAYASVERQVMRRTQELRASYAMLDKLSAQVPGALYQYRLHPDGSESIPFVSEGIRALFELDPVEVRASLAAVFARIHPEDLPAVRAETQRSGTSMTAWHAEFRVMLPHAGMIWCEARAVPEPAEGGGIVWHGFVSDITRRKSEEQKLQYIAHYDALTALPNRILLLDRLQQAMALCAVRGQSLAVAYVDLDGFKAVNDRYSHEVGDRLLEILAHRMKAALRQSDMLARIGGDEFIAVLVDLVPGQDIAPLLQRLLQAASDPVTVRDVVLQVSASIGVTWYPEDNAGVDVLLHHADQAMYQAKQAGKNRYCVYGAA